MNNTTDTKYIVRLSKSLSRVLRHSAIKDGFKIDSEGYISISDILSSKLFNQYTFEDIQKVVDENDKKRFNIKQNDNNEYFIKATQGHSIASIENLELTEIKSVDDLPEGVAIHGTFKKKWNLIKSSGLNRMKRNHVHFSIGLPDSNQVISGVRGNSELFIYVNVEKALADGIKFYKSQNDVILSEGVKGVISPEYFQYVLDAKTLKPFDKKFMDVPSKTVSKK